MVQYKYKITLVTGETREFVCKHAPEKLYISKGIFKTTYTLRTANEIVYGNVVHFELLEQIGDYTKEELMDMKPGFILLKIVWEQVAVMIILLFIVLYIKTKDSLEYLFEYILPLSIVIIIFSYTSIRCVFLNKKFTKEINECTKHDDCSIRREN